MEKLFDWENIYTEQSEELERNYELLENIVAKNCVNDILLETTFFSYKGLFSLAEVEYLLGYLLNVDSRDKEGVKFTLREIQDLKDVLENLLEAWELSNSARKLKGKVSSKEYLKNSLTASVTSDYVFQGGEKDLNLIKVRNLELFNPHNDFLNSNYGFEIEDCWNIIDFVMEKYTNVTEILTSKYKGMSDTQKIDYINELSKIDKSDFIINSSECASAINKPLEVVENFIGIFSTELNNNFEEKIKYPTDSNLFKDKPIIKLNDSYIFPCISTLIFELGPKLEELFIKDDAYRETYTAKRGEYLEEKVDEFFKNVFPNAAVYNSLYYYIEEEGQSKRCELDHLIIYDTNVFIIESKSGKFSKPARRGALNSFKKAVEENIEYAFTQAKRTKEYIEANDNPEFYDASGKQVNVDMKKSIVLNWFLLNVTLENFGEVATNLHTLNEIDLFKHDEYPWSVSLNDLTKIIKFMDHPSQFIHYVYRRLKGNNDQTNKIMAFYELDFLYHYLHHNIYFEDREKEIIFLETGGDEKLNSELNEGKDISHYKQNMPDEMSKIIRKLELDKPLGYSDLILNLYDLSEKSRRDFISGLKLCKAAFKDPSKKVQTITELENETVIYYTVCDSNIYNRELWIANTKIKFYQSRMKKIISLIKYADIKNEDFIDDLLIMKSDEWEVDPLLEEISYKIGDYRTKGDILE